MAITLDSAIEIAKANNKVIKLEDHKLKSTESLKTKAVSEFLPKVTLSGQYGQRKNNLPNRDRGYNASQIEEVRFEQPIFDGFGSIAKYNEADYQVRSASAMNLGKKQEIVLAVVKSYCNLFRYQEISKFYKESKDFSDKIFALIRRRGDARIMDEAEIVKFNYETSAIESRYFESSNKFLRAQHEYKNIVGELHENLAQPLVRDEKIDEKFLAKNAVENNNNLKSYRFNYMAAKSAYNAQKSSLLPSVTISGSVMREKNPLYLNGQDYQNRAIFLNVTVPIFQRGVEYANISKAGHDRSAAREEFEVMQENLVKDINQAQGEYDFYLRLVESSKKLVALAQKRSAILNKRFNVGVEDPIELLRAKIELNERKSDLINAQMDLVISHYNIKYLLGEI